MRFFGEKVDFTGKIYIFWEKLHFRAILRIERQEGLTCKRLLSRTKLKGLIERRMERKEELHAKAFVEDKVNRVY